MTYLQGFLVPVPADGRQPYHAMAARAVPLFHEYGALRVVECWGDDLPAGKTTDMRRAVKAEDAETVVFSWILWPDRTTCDQAAATMAADERMKPDGPMPFDGKRMVWAGFDIAYDTGEAGRFGYVDGMVASVPDGDRAAFATFAEAMAGRFIAQGALRAVDGWGVDVPPGKATDFQRAVQAGEGETVVFGWIEWPDKATRDAGMAALMEDEAMRAAKPAWNGSLAIFGGFVPILDEASRI